MIDDAPITVPSNDQGAIDLDEFASEARYCEEQYHETNNPLFAWMMWSVCRRMSQDIPTWLRDYLDKVADNLLQPALESPPKQKISDFAGRALGFQPPRKGANPFEAIYSEYRSREVLFDFLKCREGGMSVTAAYEELEERGVASKSAVRLLILEAATKFDSSHPLARYLPEVAEL